MRGWLPEEEGGDTHSIATREEKSLSVDHGLWELSVGSLVSNCMTMSTLFLITERFKELLFSL